MVAVNPVPRKWTIDDYLAYLDYEEATGTDTAQSF